MIADTRSVTFGQFIAWPPGTVGGAITTCPLMGDGRYPHRGRVSARAEHGAMGPTAL